MRKIYLTEEQFKQMMANKIHESILAEKDSGKFGVQKLNAVTTHLAKKAAQAEKDGDKSGILQQARESGINIDSLKGTLGKNDYDANVKKKVKELVDERNEELNKWFRTYIVPLRAVYNGYAFKKGEEKVTGERDASGNLIVSKEEDKFDKLDPKVRANVVNLRDFLEKEGLAFLYRRAPKLSSVKTRYGVDVANADWTTDPNKLNIDFSSLSMSDIRAYYTGTRVAWINKALSDLGYDVGRYIDEKPIRIDDTDPAWEGTDGKEGLVDIAKAGKLKQVAERYVKRTYGMDFTFGDGKKVFSFGNKKIDDRTIIINFTSAIRCPAWNECLLKDACYARTTEKNYDPALNRNLRTNLIWEQTREDRELTQLMLELIRAYIFNYHAAVVRLNKMGYRGKVNKESLSKLSIREVKDKYGDEFVNVLNETKRADVVRLNEDGDFIGQWLVDTWDKWAEDFKLAGVTVAAYTCRALNYEKVKNIILNVSQERLVAGQNAPAVARFFYAVEPEEYKALHETYGGPDGSLVIGEDGKITPMYVPLVDNGRVAGYYYKCPCGRFTGEDSDEDVETETENNGDTKVDCYRCRVCYGRDGGYISVIGGGDPIPNVPKYVLVSAHGASKENYTAKRSLAGKFTEEWIKLQGGKVERSPMMEGIDNDIDSENSELAIKKVVRNTVDSVVNMMRSKTLPMMEQTRKFNDFLNRMGGC